MEPQIPGNTSSPLDPPLKRKRGRPRKDENLVHGEPVSPMFESEHIKKAKPDAGPSVAGGDGMVGRVVQGVIDGKFDAGYLVKVKVGDTDTHLRGVVFLPGRYVPVTAANDLAPSAKMYQRTDIPIPVPNFQNQQHQFVASAGQPFKQPVQDKKLMPTFQGHGVPSIAVMGQHKQSAAVSPPLMSNLLASRNTLSSEGAAEQLKHMVSGMETLSASIRAKTVQDKAAEDHKVLQESEASALKHFAASVTAIRQSNLVPQSSPAGLQLPCLETFQVKVESKPPTGSPAIAQRVVDPGEIKCPTFDQSQIQASSIEIGAPEPAPRIVNGDTISEPNGRSLVNSFQLTGAKTQGKVRTELNFAAEGSLIHGIVPSEFFATSGAAIAKAGLDTEPLASSAATMLEAQAVLLETEPAHEGFLLSKIAEPGRCSSSGAAITKDGDIISAIPPTES